MFNSLSHSLHHLCCWTCCCSITCCYGFFFGSLLCTGTKVLIFCIASPSIFSCSVPLDGGDFVLILILYYLFICILTKRRINYCFTSFDPIFNCKHNSINSNNLLEQQNEKKAFFFGGSFISNQKSSIPPPNKQHQRKWSRIMLHAAIEQASHIKELLLTRRFLWNRSKCI